MREKPGELNLPGHMGLPYRRDIDGLRSLAVLPILFNHAGVRGFGGGYVGVDIFFVISGFLITGILVRDIERGDFSIASFYRRRILRIFPALFVMLAVVAILCVPILMPGEMIRFAHSLAGATFFSSNFVFYWEAGYFDTASESKPLLHTWSLAIEEQYYILWPLLIVAASRIGARFRIGAMAAVVAASFLFSLWQVPRDMSGAFYLLPSRAWELGLGGLAAMMPALRLPAMARQALAVTGAALIAFSVWRLFPPIAFPGATALLPCVGTVLLILFAPGTLAGRALSLAPVVFIGQISYSLYLWHWPVIVLSEVGLLLHGGVLVMAGQIAVSLLLATLSWRYVERPFRQHNRAWGDRAVLRAGGGAMATAALVAFCLTLNGGLSERFSPNERRVASFADRDYQASFRRGTCFIIEANDSFDRDHCLLGNGASPSIFVLGDSMAAQYWPGLSRYRDQYAISQATMAGCRPNLYPAGARRRCEQFFREMLISEIPRRKPSVLLLAGNWQMMDMALLEATLPILRRGATPIVLVGPVPQYAAALPRLLVSAERLGRPGLTAESLRAEPFAVDRRMAAIAKANGVAYYSPIAQLCAKDICRTYAGDQEPIQFDYGHLSPAGSDQVVDGFMPVLQEAVRGGSAPPISAEAQAVEMMSRASPSTIKAESTPVS